MDERPDAPKHAKAMQDRKSTRLNSSHSQISYAVFCLKKKKKNKSILSVTQTSMKASSTETQAPPSSCWYWKAEAAYSESSAMRSTPLDANRRSTWYVV